ncbi:MAG TPA: crossover junction endodeoxyribonuclease RuvC [Solirubrobacteraceae bacterium]|jgi:crossover junction endodeoxyribonuclease RuvC|nr:crossover junction endodeoxyribonuclease RuvC [Solirubrobacteraceae bacterium]
MVVLGIDPGLANTGYGVVAREGGRLLALDGGVVTTRAGLPIERRLAQVAVRVRELLAEHACDAVALEQLYFGANAQSAFAVGHARGVAMLVAGEHGVTCSSYTPQQVKAAVCGSGRAGKEQVARMVQTLLGLPSAPTPDHAADALAVAVCHLNGTPLADAIARVDLTATAETGATHSNATAVRSKLATARCPVAGHA